MLSHASEILLALVMVLSAFLSYWLVWSLKGTGKPLSLARVIVGDPDPRRKEYKQSDRVGRPTIRILGIACPQWGDYTITGRWPNGRFGWEILVSPRSAVSLFLLRLRLQQEKPPK
jgi:hypothetical protein